MKTKVNHSHAAASRVHLFCNLKSWVRIHAVLVIGLYELFDTMSHPVPYMEGLVYSMLIFE